MGFVGFAVSQSLELAIPVHTRGMFEEGGLAFDERKRMWWKKRKHWGRLNKMQGERWRVELRVPGHMRAKITATKPATKGTEDAATEPKRRIARSDAMSAQARRC